MAATLPGLYVTGEESLAQVAGRAARLGLPVDGVNALAETGVERILEHAVALQPKLIIADSIQTLWTESLTAAPGSVSQVRESAARLRSEEHTSELQSLMRISYAVFCLKKKKRKKNTA